jgi:hypothetical protein
VTHLTTSAGSLERFTAVVVLVAALGLVLVVLLITGCGRPIF